MNQVVLSYSSRMRGCWLSRLMFKWYAIHICIFPSMNHVSSHIFNLGTVNFVASYCSTTYERSLYQVTLDCIHTTPVSKRDLSSLLHICLRLVCFIAWVVLWEGFAVSEWYSGPRASSASSSLIMAALLSGSTSSATWILWDVCHNTKFFKMSVIHIYYVLFYYTGRYNVSIASPQN